MKAFWQGGRKPRVWGCPTENLRRLARYGSLARLLPVSLGILVQPAAARELGAPDSRKLGSRELIPWPRGPVLPRPRSSRPTQARGLGQGQATWSVAPGLMSSCVS